MTTIRDEVVCGTTKDLAGEALLFYRQYENKLSDVWRALPDKPADTPATTVAAPWHAAAGFPLSVQRANEASLPVLSAAGFECIRGLLARRIKGIPLAHLTGRQQFMGLEFVVSMDALIPRAETELLGAAALEQLRTIVRLRHQATVIDVCTGAGRSTRRRYSERLTCWFATHHIPPAPRSIRFPAKSSGTSRGWHLTAARSVFAFCND